MHRFFITPELLANLDLPLGNVVAPLAGAMSSVSPTMSSASHTILLPKDLAHQIRDVLHLAIGEQLLLLDNTGDEILAAVTESNKSAVRVQLLNRHKGKSESPIRIILCQGLLKSARFEWILEKGTELGVSVFSPILFRRSMAGLEDAGPSKIQRWQRIIQEATEQCGRSRLPQLLPIRQLMHALNEIPPGALALIPWEEERNHSLREALTAFQQTSQSQSAPSPAELPTAPTTVILFIGPEGGLMPEEVALAQRHGVRPVSLGSRILRAETAALATVANVMYELER
jgi:16S rRNA (uracil1498-N3)-methyltransferase